MIKLFQSYLDMSRHQFKLWHLSDVYLNLPREEFQIFSYINKKFLSKLTYFMNFLFSFFLSYLKIIFTNIQKAMKAGGEVVNYELAGLIYDMYKLHQKLGIELE